MMMRFLVAIAVVASPVRVSGQPAGAQAEVLFRQGRELMAAGKVSEACAAFEQSEKLEAAVTTLLNLAGCREKNGQLATAWGLFLTAERQTRSASDDATQQLHDLAKGRAQKLEPRVSKLTISVAENRKLAGLEIARDGERIDMAMWNRALPIDGGTYKITARAPGAHDWSTTVSVAPEADTKTVDIPELRNLKRDPGASKPAAVEVHGEPATLPAHGSKLLPLVVGAGALALGGVALAFELSSSSTYNQAKAEMTDQARRDSLYSSANTKYQIAQGVAVAGIACVGAAVWLYLRGRHGHGDDPNRQTVLVMSPTGIAVAGGF